MANPKHLTLLKKGVDRWNDWRKQHRRIIPDLCDANLGERDLHGVDLRGADLRGASFWKGNLRDANLDGANVCGGDDVTANVRVFKGADLTDASLRRADLRRLSFSDAKLGGADFSQSNLQEAHFVFADFSPAFFDKKNPAALAPPRHARFHQTNLANAHFTNCHLASCNLEKSNLSKACLIKASFQAAWLPGANLQAADLRDSDLSRSNLANADLRGASLVSANLQYTCLRGADLRGAALSRANLVQTDLKGAKITGCKVYGVSAWDVDLADVEQTDLVITESKPHVTVDNLEVAQFVYLLLNNRRVRDVIDTVTSKVVLILGRFTPERKTVLDALRMGLRASNYTPVLFDFEGPASRDVTETVSILAHLARFVIADLTDAKSIPQELQRIVPDLPSVPIQPLLQEFATEYGMFEHFKRYPWVLEVHRYRDVESLRLSLVEKIIVPAEAKAREQRKC